MAVHGPDRLVRVRNPLAQHLDEVAVQLGNRVANGVRHVDGGGAFGNHGFNHAAQKVRVRAVAIFRAELDVTHQVARKARGQPGLLKHLVRRHAQLLLHVQGAGRKEQVQAAGGGRLQRFRGARDVAVVGAGQRADGGLLDHFGDRSDAFEVAVRAGGKAGFDHVDAQTLQLARNAQFLIARHRGAGGLLAVAQGGVKNNEFVGHGNLLNCSRAPGIRPASRVDFRLTWRTLCTAAAPAVVHCLAGRRPGKKPCRRRTGKLLQGTC